ASLYRIFYYDAMPFEGEVANPMDGYSQNYKLTAQAKANRGLIDGLEQEADFAVRRGTLLRQGWKIRTKSLNEITRTQRGVVAKDLVPDFKQKGVDIRIGLDMAQIALNRLVDILVLVTGDSDFVPVMKFARTQGLKVYLETLGRSIRPEMRAHCDCVLS
ncbi:MAG: NYN domain-containing protein, partial [Candidatus Binataceae bacterium]